MPDPAGATGRSRGSFIRSLQWTDEPGTGCVIVLSLWAIAVIVICVLIAVKVWDLI